MPDKANILQCEVHMLSSQQCLLQIAHMIAKKDICHVITLNAEIVYKAQFNQKLRRIINGADLVTPDGIGIVWAGRMLGYDLKERVSGIDLLLSICQAAPAKGWKIYLLGSAPGVAAAAAQSLKERFPGLHVCGTHHGYFHNEEIPALLTDIKQSNPDILFVSLGAPKQEIWIDEYKLDLGVPVSIGVGGSLDVIAGIKNRAPGWMIKLNLEWLYRLLSEPSRWRRQLVLPKFVWVILREKHKRRL